MKKKVEAKVRAALDEGGPKLQCLDCGDIIRSTHRHDFVTCKCGKVSVDGGTDYFKVMVREGARTKRIVD